MLLDILLAVLVVVCVALIGVILLQRSEGGALGMSGGGPGSFMTARGTGDLLTRTTQILAAVFFALCLGMTLVSGHEHGAGSLVDKLKLNPLGAASSAPAGAPVSNAAPLMPGGTLNPLAPLGNQSQPQQAAPSQPNGGLNLLGAPQAPLAAAPVRPQQAPGATAIKPATAAKVVKVKPATAAPAPAASAPAAQPAPTISAPPLAVPPPPSAPAAPANGQ